MNPRAGVKQSATRRAGQGLLEVLPAAERAFVQRSASHLGMTEQETRQVAEIAADLAAWNEESIAVLWPGDPPPRLTGKAARTWVLERLRERWASMKAAPNRYTGFGPATRPTSAKPELVVEDRNTLGFGHCPVASPKTRCCNLMTLDAVENCGFGCSYCSIQSFYHDDRIYLDAGLAEKLRRIEIDPRQTYHIGTGQSSDSLLWGNKLGLLDELTGFARRHPNVILEMKTKSRNVAYFLEQDIPRNLICTWSLNTPTIIAHEEHQTATLIERLRAARKVADRGVLVGFHFHPMVHYHGWRADYAAVFARLAAEFDPSEVVLVSFGTLTFIKPVMRLIRGRALKTQILKMPLADAGGKFSYPEEVKLDLFRHAYRGLHAWHGRVFFYLCMEPPGLWQPVFGHDYPSNAAFEAAMTSSYLAKIHRSAQ